MAKQAALMEEKMKKGMKKKAPLVKPKAGSEG